MHVCIHGFRDLRLRTLWLRCAWQSLVVGVQDSCDFRCEARARARARGSEGGDQQGGWQQARRGADVRLVEVAVLFEVLATAGLLIIEQSILPGSQCFSSNCQSCLLPDESHRSTPCWMSCLAFIVLASSLIFVGAVRPAVDAARLRSLKATGFGEDFSERVAGLSVFGRHCRNTFELAHYSGHH